MRTRRNRQVQIFESGIEKLGRMLSKKWKIKVVFKHGKCETEGSTIYLPVVPDSAPKDLMDAMQGHLDHEVAHCVFTDFKALSAIKRREKKLFTVWNSLEDPRIEKKFAELWRGSAGNLRRSLEWTLQKIAEKHDIKDPDTGVVKQMNSYDTLSDLGKIIAAATIYAQVNFDKNHWFLTTVVPPEDMKKVLDVEDIIRAAVDAPTTQDVMKLSKDFLKRLNEEEDPEDLIDPKDIRPDDVLVPPQSPQDSVMRKKQKGDPNGPRQIEVRPPDEDEEGQPSPAPVSQAADADDEGEGEGEGDGDGEACESDAGPQPGGGKRGSGANHSGPRPRTKKGGGQQKDFDPSDKELDRDAELLSRNRMIKEAADWELKGTDTYLVYSTEDDRIEHIKDGNRSKYKDFMAHAVRMVAVMKRKLMRSMLSTQISSWEGDKLRGKINPRALHRVVIGSSKRVFRQRVASEGFNLVVQMMIDHSGSMDGEKLDLAAKTAIVLGEICHQLGIPFSVCGFSAVGGQGWQRRQKATPEEQRIYSRWGEHWIGMYKDFDEPWPTVSHRLINMVHQCRQNTYDGESLRWGAQRLLHRREERKVFFWLNDGEPCPTGADDHDAAIEYASLCGKEVDKLVELVAIGIMTDAVKRFYKNWTVVNDIDDLVKVCLSELDRLLRKGKEDSRKRRGKAKV